MRDSFFPGGLSWFHLLACVAAAILPVNLRLHGQQTLPREPRDGRTVDGQVFHGALTGIDTQQLASFQSASQVESIPLAELVHWGSCQEIERDSAIILSDGSLLVLDQSRDLRQVDGNNVVVFHPLFGSMTVTRNEIRALALRLPAKRLDRDRLLVGWTGYHEQPQGSVILSNGDRLDAHLLALDVQTARLETAAGNELAVPRTRIAAMELESSDRGAEANTVRRLDTTQLLVGLWDGSVLRASTVYMAADRLSISLVNGVTLSADLRGRRAEHPPITLLQPVAGVVAYLADLPCASYTYTPFLTGTWSWARDRNVLGGRLRSGDGVYAKGIGMHSQARLEYVLSGAYRRFEAELAADDVAGRAGSAVCHVETRGPDGVWQTVYTSPVIRGGGVEPVRVDVRGKQGLALQVDYGDRADEHDYVNWLSARLIAEDPTAGPHKDR